MTILRVDTIAGTGTTFGPLLDGNLEFNSQNYIVLPKGSSNQQGVLRTTEDVIGVGGTYYDNLVLAMPFNEATGLRDVSSRNRNPGTYGNVSISSTISKYYGSSAKFDGSGDYMQVTDNGDFSASGDFTIECWGYLNSLPDFQYFLGKWNNGSNQREYTIQVSSSGEVSFWWSTDGTTNGRIASVSGLVTTNQWNHYVWEKSGTILTGYVNGVAVGIKTDLTSQYNNIANPLFIGSLNDSTSINGYIQDLRIYKGIAKYTANFTPPERIAETGVGFKTGALRYNTDSNKPELYDGNQWTELQISNVGLGTDGDTGPGARGVFGGGDAPGVQYNTIDYINISSTGNAQDFGDLVIPQVQSASCSSSTRGIFGGGFTSPGGATLTNTIAYVTISSTGDAQDFGDLSAGKNELGAVSNSTRGVFGGGLISPTLLNVLEYVTISSTGDTKDFGDLSTARSRCGGGIASQTRGVFGSGYTPSASNVIEFITISTLGDAQDFGDLSVARGDAGGLSNSTRGLLGGGYTPSLLNTIDYITISSLGNAVNFGSLTDAREGLEGCASPTRGVWGGGYSPGFVNVMDYVTILTQGNAVDFGDLSTSKSSPSACSNAHGGL